jgi:hypothetical protein
MRLRRLAIGGKSAAREEIVRKFVRTYLPRQTEVTGRSEIITADEQVSPECDLMVIDATAPPLMDARHQKPVLVSTTLTSRYRRASTRAITCTMA